MAELISDLSAEANAYTFSPHVSFAAWLNVGRSLLREARIYDHENEHIARAYVLYLRFADLVLNKLRSHPDFSRSRKQYTALYSDAPSALERSEALKTRIQAAAAEDERIRAKSATAASKTHATNSQTPHNPSSFGDPSASAGLSLEDELKLYEDDRINTPQFIPLVNTLRPASSNERHYNERHAFSGPSVNIPQYPTLPQAPDAARPAGPPFSQAGYATGPVLPRKPAHPPLQISATAKLENGELLRQVLVPRSLREQFLRIARPNTSANLETCGMLCGRLERNAFFVTDLLIPHQTSTPDSCATTNEEEIFEYVDQRDLFILGWIHTHPSQTCFMSSVDLHTHASYQLMLPEAVALVCAPTSSPDWSAFRLTDPPGMPTIRKCTLTGFHPHENADSLYTAASGSGHYREIDATLTAKDLRD